MTPRNGWTGSLRATLFTLPFVLAPSLAAAAADYRPYTPGSGVEQVSAPLFVVMAYSVIWLVLLGFVVSVWRRQRRIEDELEQLRRQLER